MPIADCGHEYTEPEPGQSGASGYARDEDGRTFCYPCADEMQREAIKTADRTGGYFHVPAPDIVRANTIAGIRTEKTITTWTGGFLMRVTYAREGRHNIGGKLYRLRATDCHGAEWYGTSPGPGMYVRLRRAKTGRTQTRTW